MHDNWLIAISMTVASLGIVCLLFALIFLEVPESSIRVVAQELDGTPVRVKGAVKNVQYRNNMTIISLEQPATIDITLFEVVNITSDCVIAQGRKGSYKDTAQITATKIIKC